MAGGAHPVYVEPGSDVGIYETAVGLLKAACFTVLRRGGPGNISVASVASPSRCGG
jgi:hypothetical protein